jgi:hypothetical protein
VQDIQPSAKGPTSIGRRTPILDVDRARIIGSSKNGVEFQKSPRRHLRRGPLAATAEGRAGQARSSPPHPAGRLQGGWQPRIIIGMAGAPTSAEPANLDVRIS